MGWKIRTILAQLCGLESQKKSGHKRGVFLDCPFYRTYQELAEERLS
jgi:predicted DNA-binding ribbon-helix-helix protein